jgi:hypothetical protein
VNSQFWVIFLALSLRGADFAQLLWRVCSLWSLDSGSEGLSFFLIKMGLYLSVTFLESFYLV